MQSIRLRDSGLAILTACLLIASTVCGAQSSYPGTNNSFPEDLGPPNDPPVWNNTPAPVFTEGVAASYDLTDCVDPEADPLTFVNEAGCTLSVGMSIDNANDELDEDGTSPAATTTSCVFSCDDGVNTPVDSDPFSIVVSSLPALGTIYERDMFGTPRTGTSGAVEQLGSHTGNPVAELDDVVPIDISDYPCDATVTTGDGDWTTKVNNASNVIVCIAAGDHSAKDTMSITDGGSAGTSRTISAVTLDNPVRIDFTAAHGWTTDDIIHCDDGAGGTWQLRWRFFRVTVIDTDTIDLQSQDGTGAGVRPAWTTYTSGGTCQRPNFKIIRHAVDITEHPVQLTSGNRAKVMRFECGTSSGSNSYLMILGLSIDAKGLYSVIGTTANNIWGCDYLIVDFNHFYNDEALTDIEADFTRTALNFRDTSGDSTSNYIQIQRNFFDERGADGLGTDSHWTSISVGDTRAIHLIKNESSSAMSAWQTSNTTPDLNEGFLFAENSDWLDTSQYTDCAGNVVGGTTFGADTDDPCAVAESAGAFKNVMGSEGRVTAAVATRHRIAVVDANVQCCRRGEDGVISDGGSGGQSYGFSGAAGNHRNVLWRNNIAWSEEKGLAGLNSNAGQVNNYQTLVGNIQYDITFNDGIALPWFTFATVTTEKMEAMFNTFVSTNTWLQARRVENTVFECNLLIDAGDRTGTTEGDYVQKNNYGYGATTQLDGTGDNDGGAVSNANMADLIVNPKIWSDPTFEYTIPGVLSTVSSPQLSDCPSIGTADRGVTDDTVTF